MSLRFGTDGVRGRAGSELTPELVLSLGRAAARVLGGREFLVGRDTRVSGPMLQAALSAGLTAEGVDVVDLGVLPTPGVAAAAAERAVPAAVISASHNPYHDNGVKLLAAGGTKLTDAQEQLVEEALVNMTPPKEVPAVMGRLTSDPYVFDWYCARVVDALDGRRLGGMRVVIDCANGAATGTAVRILRAAGADVVEVLSARPDGYNINDGCGSTDPSALSEAVVAKRADVGLALDGDADRVIAVDENGEIIDGDRLLALFALDLHERKHLDGDTLVVTVMSNLGLQKAMESAGIRVHRTGVGDRSVLEALDGNGWKLGGEQSGHIIFRELATTGDGVMSGMLLVDLVKRSGRRLSEMAQESMVRLPQIHLNVEVPAGAGGVSGSPRVVSEIRSVEGQLGESGRVVLRASGTEPLVRVMVEAETEDIAVRAAQRLVDAVREAAVG